jgi:hypothetical protein
MVIEFFFGRIVVNNLVSKVKIHERFFYGSSGYRLPGTDIRMLAVAHSAPLSSGDKQREQPNNRENACTRLPEDPFYAG